MEIRYFDTETTGLGPEAEIIQVGIIDGLGNVLMDTLVKCEGDIPEEATAIHGISKEDLANAPTWPDIHEEVCALLSNIEFLKIYNASYDLRLLRQTAKRYDLDVPKIRALCVMREYAGLHFDGEWIKLTEACHYENIETKNLKAHDAIADCQMTRLLDIEIGKEKEKRKKRKAQREKLKEEKLALVPGNVEEYPDFGMGHRPKGYKTLSQLNKRDLKSFEFAGVCCDTYGGKGYLFKPKD